MTFLPQEVIIRKRDGATLTRGEIGQFIAGLTDGSVSHAQAAAFAMAVFFRDMNLDERVALTEAMRDSGTVLDWSDLDGPVVRVATPDVPIPFSPPLEDAYLPGRDEIAAAVRLTLGR